MSTQDEVTKAFEVLSEAIRQPQLEVTRLDTEQLRSDISSVNTKVTYSLVGLGFVLTLLIATYGLHAFFTWRLVSTLLSAD